MWRSTASSAICMGSTAASPPICARSPSACAGSTGGIRESALTTSNRLFQNLRRLSGCCREVAEKQRGTRAIGDAVIAWDGERHHGPDRGLALHGYDPVGNASDRENRGLRRGDDRAELIDLIHAEVADSKCGVGNIRWPQLPCLRALGYVAPLDGDLSQACGVRVVNDGSNHAVVYRNGDAHVHVIVKANSLGAPARVQSRMLQQHAGC